MWLAIFLMPAVNIRPNKKKLYERKTNKMKTLSFYILFIPTILYTASFIYCIIFVPFTDIRE